MKVAPIHRALLGRPVRQRLVHTGQHHDVKMSDVFFVDLGMPTPDVHLGVSTGSHAQQTARVMIELERIFLEEKPDLVSVVGDVNSTLAAALVAAKLQIPVSHVEAGLRSFDRTMPEEVNRLVTDQIADILLTPSPDGDANLLREGVAPERIFRVGNVMIDTLLASRERALRLPTLQDFNISPGQYAVCTLHRPSNVDDPKVFEPLLRALGEISQKITVLFPVHPRTRKNIDEQGLSSMLQRSPQLRLIEPLGYLDFLSLTAQAKLILTDSGGLQEESTALNIPCLTLRQNTERPITVEVGSNQVVGTKPERILDAAYKVLAGTGKQGRVPELWDGHAAERIADVYVRFLSAS